MGQFDDEEHYFLWHGRSKMLTSPSKLEDKVTPHTFLLGPDLSSAITFYPNEIQESFKQCFCRTHRGLQHAHTSS